MIARLRRRHRRLIPVLGVAAALLLGAALAVRPPPALNATLAFAGNKPAATAVLIAEEKIDLDGVPLDVQVYAASAGRRSIALTTPPSGAAGAADVLVYWHNGVVGTGVPPEAELLGTLAGPQTRVFALPEQKHAGLLLFYSLARDRLYTETVSLTAMD